LINEAKNGGTLEESKEKLSELNKRVGSSGIDRQKLIKTAVNIIIENIIPERMRVLFNIVKHESDATFEDYEKLYKMNKKNFEVEIKNSKYNEIDKFHYMTRVHPDIYYKMKDLNDKNRFFHRKFQEVVHEQVRVRNRIIILQNEWTLADKPSDIGLTCTNILNFMEYTKHLEQTPTHNIFNSWSITRKENSKIMFDNEESVAMTDMDNDDPMAYFK